jgi:hypothetical protein
MRKIKLGMRIETMLLSTGGEGLFEEVPYVHGSEW